MSVSTHVLDAARGRPAVDIEVVLEAAVGDGWREIARARTDADGRIGELAKEAPAGIYRLNFSVDDYLAGETFFPEVMIVFRIRDASEHHHVPLLLSPYAYSTYRGS